MDKMDGESKPGAEQQKGSRKKNILLNLALSIFILLLILFFWILNKIIGDKINHSSGYFPNQLAKHCQTTYNDVSA